MIVSDNTFVAMLLVLREFLNEQNGEYFWLEKDVKFYFKFLYKTAFWLNFGVKDTPFLKAVAIFT